MKIRTLRPAMVTFLLTLVLAACSSSQTTDVNGHAAEALTTHNVYVAPHLLPADQSLASALRALRQQIRHASDRGVNEKVAIIADYPRNFTSLRTATDGLLSFLGLSGVLVLVTPGGLGISSDEISSSQIREVQQRVPKACQSRSISNSAFVMCGVDAARLAVDYVKQDTKSAQHSVVVVWIYVSGAVLVALGVVAPVMWRHRRRPVRGLKAT